VTTRILIVDDHQVMREGLRALLEHPPQSTVIGDARNGREAVVLARQLQPDVVILDIAMPELNGIEATRKILAQSADLKVIALSMHKDRSYVSGMLEAGASGYVPKESAFEEIAAAIDTVLKGQIYLGASITGIVIDDYINLVARQSSAEASPLTDREREVLQLLAEGRKTAEIATTLNVSVKTVETHRRQIMLKLDLHSVAELTKYAIRTGLTSLDE